MDDEQLKTALAHLADRQQCPKCGEVGFDTQWSSVVDGEFGQEGTPLIMTGADEVPWIECRACGAGTWGVVMRQ